MENTVTTFGKYMGCTYGEIYDTNRSYAIWCTTRLSPTDDNRINFINFVKNKMEDRNNTPIVDILLKDAWYTSHGKYLLDHGFNPQLDIFPVNMDIFPEIWTTTKPDNYDKIINEPNHINSHMKILLTNGFNYDGTNYYLSLTIINLAIKLYPQYLKNERQDQYYKRCSIPSKIINTNWVQFKHVHNIPDKGQGQGMWCLFFDKEKENEDGLTKLDINYQIICENYENIMRADHDPIYYNIGSSTRKPSDRAQEGTNNGCIIICCNIKDRDAIIHSVRKYIEYKDNIYWKHHCATNSGNGVSSHTSLYIKN